MLNSTFINLIGVSKSSATFVNKGLNNVEVINSIIYSNALKLIDGNVILNENKYEFMMEILKHSLIHREYLVTH